MLSKLIQVCAYDGVINTEASALTPSHADRPLAGAVERYQAAVLEHSLGLTLHSEGDGLDHDVNLPIKEARSF